MRRPRKVPWALWTYLSNAMFGRPFLERALQSARNSKRMRIVLGFIVFAPLAWWGFDAGVGAFSSRYRIGVDMQQVSCLPYRFFLVSNQPFKPVLERGDMVLFHTDLALFKEQFPGEDDIAKFIAGLPGDRIDVRDDRFYINGAFWDRLWLMKFLKAEPGQFDRSFVVPEGHYLVAATSPGSYDGRYWGTISEKQIKGYVRPLL